MNTFPRYGESNVYALPSIHYCEEFVSEALRGGLGSIDILALELPGTWDERLLARQILRVRPALGVCILPAGDRRLMDVPTFPGSPETERREVRAAAAALPIVVDSITSLLSLAHDPASAWRPAVHLVDAAPDSSLQPREEPDSADDLLAIDPVSAQVEGLCAWYRRRAGHFARAAAASPDFAGRNVLMASRLRKITEAHPGQNILHVSGASHIGPIGELLQGRLPEPEEIAVPTSAPCEFVVGTLSGPEAHLLGWADVPWFHQEYARGLASGVFAFDRLALFDTLIEKCLAGAGRRVSVRSVAMWMDLMRRMLTSKGFRSLRLDDMILALDAAVGSPTFSSMFWEMATEHRLSPSDPSVPACTVIPGVTPGETFLQFGARETYVLRQRPGRTYAYRRMMVTRPGRVHRNGSGIDLRLNPVTMSPPSEERLLKNILDQARAIAHRDLMDGAPPLGRPRKFRAGRLGKVDWRKTVWATARGGKDIYLRGPARDVDLQQPCEDCAVVFLLNPVADIDDTVTVDYWVDDRLRPAQYVYANFLWFQRAKRRTFNGLEENFVAIRVRLYRKLPAVYTRDFVRDFLDGLRPKRDLCTIRPDLDPALREFRASPVSLALAAAARWTIGNHVTVVSETSPAIDSSVISFAESLDVRILFVPQARFADQLIFERFCWDTAVPTQGPFEAPHPRDLAKVRAVPGYDQESDYQRAQVESVT